MNNTIKMRHCLLLCFCCVLCTQMKSIGNEYSKETNIFEYGEPLTSSDVNFEFLTIYQN